MPDQRTGRLKSEFKAQRKKRTNMQNLEELHKLVECQARFAYRRFGWMMPLEDIRQEGYVGLFSALQTVDHGSETARAYLQTRVLGAILDSVRRTPGYSSYRSRNFESHYHVPLTESSGVDGRFEDRLVRRMTARQLVERGNKRERTVLKAYYFEERKLKEIGSEIGVNESRVSQIVGDAVGRMRQTCNQTGRRGTLVSGRVRGQQRSVEEDRKPETRLALVSTRVPRSRNLPLLRSTDQASSGPSRLSAPCGQSLVSTAASKAA
jgi:RNA polymerase sigma factor (sigma-70 family)